MILSGTGPQEGEAVSYGIPGIAWPKTNRPEATGVYFAQKYGGSSMNDDTGQAVAEWVAKTDVATHVGNLVRGASRSW